MATINFRVEGLKGVIDTLKQLPPEVVSKRGGPIRSALYKAAKVIQTQARENVQTIVDTPNRGGSDVSTGALKESITIKRRKPKGNGETYTVGISPIKRFYADTKHNVRKQRVGKGYYILPPTYYAWFLEFGTERMQPHPFMRPAYEAKKEEAVETFVTETNKGIERVLKKLQKQNRVKE